VLASVHPSATTAAWLDPALLPALENNSADHEFLGAAGVPVPQGRRGLFLEAFTNQRDSDGLRTFR